MRRFSLGLLILGAVNLGLARVASAGLLAPGGLGWQSPVVVLQPYAPAPLYPGYGYGFPYDYPYPYAHSYFRPAAPDTWNPYRNWRDTWQDDGVKVHSYTLH
jgi:hypothetical protein